MELHKITTPRTRKQLLHQSTMSPPLEPNAAALKAKCPDLCALLGYDLVDLLDPTSTNDGGDDTRDDYWDQVHLMFIFRVLVSRTKSELAMASLKCRPAEATNGNISDADANISTSSLSERLQLFRSLLAALEDVIENSNSPTGLIMTQLATSYHLTLLQLRVVQLLVTAKAQPSPSILELCLQQNAGPGYLAFVSPGDEKMASEHAPVKYACGATTLDWNVITNEDFALVADHILTLVEEDFGDNKLAVSDEACRALVGMDLTMEDKLKLSGTKLLQIVAPDEARIDASERATSADTNTNNMSSDAINSMLKTLNIDGGSDDDDTPIDGVLVDKAAVPQPTQDEEENGELISKADLDAIADITTETSSKDDIGDADIDPTQPRPYNNELEYLTDMFEVVMHKVIYSRQRIAQDLRKASVVDNKQPSWMRGNDTASKKSVGEISAKIKLARRKIDVSLELTRQEGVFFPRLELLVDQLKLNAFQQFVLIYLAGSMISPIFKSCIKSDDMYSRENVTVGDLLLSYFDDFADQVAGRTFFYKTSKLVKKGLIRFTNTCRNASDLTDQEVALDRRVLDCIVGLDKESAQITHGSHLYDPRVKLEAVVLPQKMKDTIASAVTHFDQFRKYRKHNPDFDENISYGVGLTLMFCGPSGTGKTMTANAIAAKLGKKLLLVNFPFLSQGNSTSNEESSRYQAIFREAELSDAIIFFDECESLFSKRTRGGSADTTELLTELERYEGIVFLATNRPYDLDEAMYRRISEVFEFKAPNYLERLDIGKLVTSPKSVPCDPNIDWEAMALKYELTGGFIKNAVMSALLDAVGRNPKNPVVTQKDIIDGCKKQVRGALQMVECNERVLPQAGLDELVATEAILDQLRQMVSLEKARGILFGSWGFDNDMRSRQGTTALFWGPSGTGRSRAAEAIGFELGKPLKVVDLPHLLEQRSNDNQSSGAASIRNVFKDARLQDAVLVLDGFALHTDGGGGGHGGEDSRLLNLVIREMTRFPGVVIMNVDTAGSLDVFVSRLDKGLLSGLKFLVEFQLPTQSNLRLLWEKLMPPSVPLAEEINFKSLAEMSRDFSLSQIGNVIYRAAANAALRDASKRCVSMKDLFAAIEGEKRRGKSAVDRWVKAQYV